MAKVSGIVCVADRLFYQGFFLFAAMEAAFLINGVGWCMEGRKAGMIFLGLGVMSTVHTLHGVRMWEQARHGVSIRQPGTEQQLAPPTWLAVAAMVALAVILFIASGQWSDPRLPLWFRPFLLVACNGFGIMVLLWMRTFIEFMQQHRQLIAVEQTF